MTDMYQWNTCHMTYCRQCLLDLGCYTDAKRDASYGIKANSDWARSHLTPTTKKWAPTWESEELLNEWKSLKRTSEFY